VANAFVCPLDTQTRVAFLRNLAWLNRCTVIHWLTYPLSSLNRPRFNIHSRFHHRRLLSVVEQAFDSFLGDVPMEAMPTGFMAQNDYLW
jgi:hypothetical protein